MRSVKMQSVSPSAQLNRYAALIVESGRICKVFSFYYDNLSFDIFILYVQTDRRQLLKASLNLSEL
jgi:hypothetical protein